MKHLKMLGLAAVAAMALMSLFGVGSASAANTTLCSTNTNPCTGTTYGVGTTIHATLAKEHEGGIAKLVAGFATVECTTSTVHGKIEDFSATGTPTGKISTLNFETCENGCVVKVLANGSLEITTDTEGVANGNGRLIGRNTSATITCAGVSCNFGTAATGTALGTVTGGNPAVFVANAKLPYIAGDASNFICTVGSGTGSWTATYNITEPKPLFVE
jgi:hypothetical protein